MFAGRTLLHVRFRTLSLNFMSILMSQAVKPKLAINKGGLLQKLRQHQ